MTDQYDEIAKDSKKRPNLPISLQSHNVILGYDQKNCLITINNTGVGDQIHVYEVNIDDMIDALKLMRKLIKRKKRK